MSCLVFSPVTPLYSDPPTFRSSQRLNTNKSTIAAAAARGFFLALALITGQIGGSDIKLAALAGMLPRWLGWNHFALALLSGLLLAGVTATVLIGTRRISRRDPLPLGAFLLAGALLGMLASVLTDEGMVGKIDRQPPHWPHRP
jgi:prepilin signal peptidase PulO-like enzyme (type II secretory pathway)